MPSTGDSAFTCPDKDEIEVSVFGPGFGECILIHIGFNEWIIVDSCIHPHNKQPASLEYLKKLGVDPAACVKQVIATHWHDDHVRGLGTIVNECRSAEFSCSSALTIPEFLIFVKAYNKPYSMMESTGVDEFGKVLAVLAQRRKEWKGKFPKFAVSGLTLWQQNHQEEEQNFSCKLMALSPSNEAVGNAKLALQKLIPVEGNPKSRVPSLSPNQAAVVLWIDVLGEQILLGSDLEEIGKNGAWSLIVASDTRPQEKANLFKIPHHGSQNAHCDEVWLKMVHANAVSVLTPFRRGSGLPTQKDVARILKRCENSFITARTAFLNSKKREPMVERTIRESGIQMRQIDPHLGHFRFRKKQGDSVHKIELFGDAMHLQKMQQFMGTS